MKTVLIIVGGLIIIGSFMTLAGGKAPFAPGFFLLPVVIGGVLIYYGKKKGGKNEK